MEETECAPLKSADDSKPGERATTFAGRASAQRDLDRLEQ